MSGGWMVIMRTETVFKTLVYSPFIHTYIHTHTHIYIYIYIYIYVTDVCFYPTLLKKLSQLHACMHRYIFRAFTSRNIWWPATWVRIKPRPPRYAVGIAMFEYRLALSITHSSLDNKKLDMAEFLVLYMFTILWLHFLYVKMQFFFFF